MKALASPPGRAGDVDAAAARRPAPSPSRLSCCGRRRHSPDQAHEARGRHPRPGAGRAAGAAGPGAAPGALRRVQRRPARQRRRAGAREGHRFVRQQADARSSRSTTTAWPGRCRSSETRTSRSRSSTWRSRSTRVGRRPAGPRRSGLETNDLDRAQKTFRALLLQRLDADAGHLEGRGLLLPRRDQREAGRQDEGDADVRAGHRERSGARARAAKLTELKAVSRWTGAAASSGARLVSGARSRASGSPRFASASCGIRRSSGVRRSAVGARLLARHPVAAARVEASAAHGRARELVARRRDAGARAGAAGPRVVRGSSSRGGARGLARARADDAARRVPTRRSPSTARAGRAGVVKGGVVGPPRDGRGARADGRVACAAGWSSRARGTASRSPGRSRGSTSCSARPSTRGARRRSRRGGASLATPQRAEPRRHEPGRHASSPSTGCVAGAGAGHGERLRPAAFSTGTPCSRSCAPTAARPFALEEHLARLRRSAEKVFIVSPVDEATLAREVDARRCAAAGNAESYVRIVLTRGSGPLSLDPDTAQRHPLRVILVEPVVSPAARRLRRGHRPRHGARCAAPSDARRPRARRSPTTCQPPGAARGQRRRRAEAAGRRRARASRGGRVVQRVRRRGPAALATPPESAGILAGITRAHVLAAAARPRACPVDEREPHARRRPRRRRGLRHVEHPRARARRAGRRPRRGHRRARAPSRALSTAASATRRHGRPAHALGLADAFSGRGDGVDLDQRALRQRRDLHGRAGRVGRLEEARRTPR